MNIAYNFLSFIKCVMQPSTAGVGGDIQLYTHLQNQQNLIFMYL